jgi:hypothetical protein
MKAASRRSMFARQKSEASASPMARNATRATTAQRLRRAAVSGSRGDLSRWTLSLSNCRYGVALACVAWLDAVSLNHATYKSNCFAIRKRLAMFHAPGMSGLCSGSSIRAMTSSSSGDQSRRPGWISSMFAKVIASPMFFAHCRWALLRPPRPSSPVSYSHSIPTACSMADRTSGCAALSSPLSCSCRAALIMSTERTNHAWVTANCSVAATVRSPSSVRLSNSSSKSRSEALSV